VYKLLVKRGGLVLVKRHGRRIRKGVLKKKKLGTEERSLEEGFTGGGKSAAGSTKRATLEDWGDAL